jgi:hypothetical protein
MWLCDSFTHALCYTATVLRRTTSINDCDPATPIKDVIGALPYWLIEKRILRLEPLLEMPNNARSDRQTVVGVKLAIGKSLCFCSRALRSKKEETKLNPIVSGALALGTQVPPWLLVWCIEHTPNASLEAGKGSDGMLR